MANVAIAILNYNGREHLATFLPSVIEHSGDCDIIIGDNGSTDSSLDFIRNQFPTVKCIDLKHNNGYAGGYNRLLRQINAPYVVLLNSDVEVTPGWITPMLDILTNNQQVAAVQPKILSYKQRDFFEYAGAGGGYIDQYGYPFCRGRVFDTLEPDLGQYDDDRQVFWASGACFMLRKTAFEAAQGFDETFFAHMEEIDLNWTLQEQGYEIRYTGASKVYHLGGGTLSYRHPKKTYLNFRNSWITLIKHTRSRHFFIFGVRGLLDLISIFYFLLQLKGSSALAVVRALFYIAFNLKKTQHPTPTNSTISTKNQVAKFSIVWQYYIRNKKRFNDLIPD